MSAKRIAFDQEAREAIRRGVKQLARATSATVLAEAIFEEGKGLETYIEWVEGIRT